MSKLLANGNKGSGCDGGLDGGQHETQRKTVRKVMGVLFCNSVGCSDVPQLQLA